MNSILKVGFIYGLFGILSTLIITFIDKPLMFTGAVTWGSLLIGLIILVFAGRKYFRNEDEGILSYGAAMKNLLLASLIGMLLSQVFAIAKFSNDSEMKTLFKEYTIELTESMMRMTMGFTGADESQIEDTVAKALDELEENVDKSYPFTWAKLPMNMINIIIMSLILAFIAAIFVREKETAYN